MRAFRQELIRGPSAFLKGSGELREIVSFIWGIAYLIRDTFKRWG